MTDSMDLKNVTNDSLIVKNELLMSASSYIGAAVVLSLIGIFGFILNLSVIVLIWKDKQLRNPMNLIIFNLVFSDFLVAILGNPWTLTSAISKGWIWGRTVCVFYGFLMSLLGITSITTLTVLALERFIIVSKPLQRRRLQGKTNVIFIILGIWTYSLFLTTPPLFGWGKFVTEAANISCSVNWEDRSPNAQSYIIYLFFFGLVAPLVIIVYSYARIISIMRAKKMKTGQVHRVESKINCMILVMILAFLVAWAPYAIFALLAQFAGPSLISPATGVLPALIAKSSICYNPIIYVGFNGQFRQSLRQFLGNGAPRAVNNTCVTVAMAASNIISPINTQDDTPEVRIDAQNSENGEDSPGERESLECSPDGRDEVEIVIN